MADRNADAWSFPRGIDVNLIPSLADCDDEVGVSSPNSTISSISGKRNEREQIGEETEAERASCSRGDGGSDDEDVGAGGDASRKKLRLSKEQSLLLEDAFKEGRICGAAGEPKLRPKPKPNPSSFSAISSSGPTTK